LSPPLLSAPPRLCASIPVSQMLVRGKMHI
jgi:hypothetical protein